MHINHSTFTPPPSTQPQHHGGVTSIPAYFSAAARCLSAAVHLHNELRGENILRSVELFITWQILLEQHTEEEKYHKGGSLAISFSLYLTYKQWKETLFLCLRHAWFFSPLVLLTVRFSIQRASCICNERHWRCTAVGSFSVFSRDQRLQ